MPPRAKRSSAAATKPQLPARTPSTNSPGTHSQGTTSQPAKPTGRTLATRRSSSRLPSNAPPIEDIEHCPGVVDGADALRASPDAENTDRFTPPIVDQETEVDIRTPPEEREEPAPKRRKKAPLVEQGIPHSEHNESIGGAVVADPDLGGEDGASPEELNEALGRPPPVNSGYLPLPWKGRLGYACLNTYLRTSTPPVFSSRTCRIASILEHRHPLADPSEPEHATKNRPDRDEPASIERGQRYVEAIGLANARDIIKLIRWNDRYNIKFMRLSSEMFPFASHEEYGYKLAPFASETLAEAGRVIAELGHRVSTHPGQFTQLGSPRKSVVDNAFRDLIYHDEMLGLLKLPKQMDKDAIMILHMGGVFGDREATLDRFRENYAKLSESVKRRLVLENDDVSWSVHDLLPICQELNIPLVLDYHHHNIVFDSTKVREGTLDIINLYDEIAETWKQKGITQKMHYSEPTPPAVTPRQRRKHAGRVMTLPPCDPTMDLMIEAKDKEQAVFELMRTFKLPGFDTFSEIIPHRRDDESKAAKAPPKKAKKGKKAAEGTDEDAPMGTPAVVVSEEDTGMGGTQGRVYWPPGMEEWLRPLKRVVKKKDQGDTPAKPTRGKKAAAASIKTEGGEDGNGRPRTRKTLPKRSVKEVSEARFELDPSTSEDSDMEDVPSDFSAEEIVPVSKRARRGKEEAPRLSRRSSGRNVGGAKA